MSTGASGSDEKISATKIAPLDSGVKTNTTHDLSSRGSAGTDRNIDQTRIDPLGGKGQNQHTLPHSDAQGSVGRDETIQGAKIEPLAGKQNEATRKDQGTDEENVDSTRIPPLGAVREKTPPP
ncbi:hypothetical protein ABEF95_012908 [Exophiala dermatitidis]